MSGVSLLEVEPDLEAFLTDEQGSQAVHYALPAMTIEKDADVTEVLELHQAFGAIVREGVLFQDIQIAERASLRLIGPDGVVPSTPTPPATVLTRRTVRTGTRSRLALLDDHFLVAARRWPALTRLLYTRAMEQADRLSTQLAISHIPRVEDRLMALMWLLAEQWGHVTSAGIRLRLGLTHEALGAMIGAQRPTVTIAVSELADRGSLIKQDNDWLILDPPPELREVTTSRLLDERQSAPGWKSEAQAQPPRERLALIRAELHRMRAEYATDRQLARDLQGQARDLRTRTHALIDDARALAIESADKAPN